MRAGTRTRSPPCSYRGRQAASPPPWTPYALWRDGMVTYGIPRPVIASLLDMDPALRGRRHGTLRRGRRSLALCTAISEVLQVDVGDEALLPAASKQPLGERGVRVLAAAAAATKRGVLPTNDNLSRAKRVAARLGEGEDRS